MEKNLLGNFGIELKFLKNMNLSSISRDSILSLVQEYKLVLIRGIEGINKENFLEFISKNPREELVHWDFGPLMEMKVDPSAQNYLFSREAVPFHWDGAFHEEPRILAFHCVSAPNPNMGGQTIFSDAEAIYAGASDTEKSKWEKISLTYETERKAHYGGKITNALLAKHPDRNVKIIRFAEPVNSNLNPVRLQIDGCSGDSIEFISGMQKKLYSEDYLYEHEWEDNDLLFADNFSLLHGRREFSQASSRHLRRAQLR